VIPSLTMCLVEKITKKEQALVETVASLGVALIRPEFIVDTITAEAIPKQSDFLISSQSL